jgi:hypothetical protein
LNGFEHPSVNEAPAQHTGERLPDFDVGRLRPLVEKGFRGEDHATQAEAALGCFLVYECLLNRVRFFGCAQPLQGYDLLAIHRAQGRNAGAHRTPIHEDRTSTALTQPATKFRSSQVQFVTEYIEQRGFRIGINQVNCAIDS